ncbi:GtrA family protein [Pseudosulfitobacter koreensis]|uniref:GtrA family protein n=1 Tax=Pseudosulfitobacter koreensis TaxID=2968472 RepID=A0ABT1Z3E6_9RHOB|nr:GtrA family protein [Pseudosulfitobacter koreense]
MATPARIIRFAIIGVLIAVLYMLLYLAFLQIGMSLVAANALAFVIAIAAQYAGQARFTFERRLADPGQVLRFGVMTGCGFVTSALVTGLLGPMLGLEPWLAALMVMLVLPVQNFIIMTLWVFAKSAI